MIVHICNGCDRVRHCCVRTSSNIQLPTSGLQWRPELPLHSAAAAVPTSSQLLGAVQCSAPKNNTVGSPYTDSQELYVYCGIRMHYWDAVINHVGIQHLKCEVHADFKLHQSHTHAGARALA